MVRASCHCGKVTLRIDGPIPEALTRCTCSFCAKRGVLYAYYPPEAVHVEAAPDADAVYRWQTGLVAHHFCASCGCTTYSDSPAFERDGTWDQKTRRVGANARLFHDFVAAEAEVTVIDGKNLW